MQEQDFFGSKLPNKCITHHTAAGGAAVDMGEREEITASFTRLKSSFLHKDTSFSLWSWVPVATAKNEASSSTRRVEQYLPQPEPRSYHNALRPPLLEFGRNLRPPSTIYMNLHYDKHIENFPQRPGKPECRYFLKTGLCKFNSTCKFHHPKDRIARLVPMCDLNDKGLPLRPYEDVCWHYISHGTCQYGAACMFHHPQLSLDFIDIP